MKKILIPNSENQNRSILIALSLLKEYGGMKFGEIGELSRKFFKGEDIFCNIQSNSPKELFESLDFEGFIYQIIEE